MRERTSVATALTVVLACWMSGAAGAQGFEVGGPLAGLKLPQNKLGQWGEVELYPGSVEHYRTYSTKFVPVRSFFDKQSLIKDWVAPAIPGAEGRKAEQFAAPIYKLNRDFTGPATGEFAPPAPVIRCAVKSPVFKLDLAIWTSASTPSA